MPINVLALQPLPTVLRLEAPLQRMKLLLVCSGFWELRWVLINARVMAGSLIEKSTCPCPRFYTICMASLVSP